MTTSIDNLQPGQQPASSSNKPLWAAVAILGVAVLGMAGTMIYNQRAPAPAATTVAAVTTPQTAAAPQGAAPAASVNADRKSTRLNSSHIQKSRMPSSA